MASPLEKKINQVLWVLLLIILAVGGMNWWEKAMEPKPFEQPETHAPPLYKLAERVPASENAWLTQHLARPVAAQGEAPEGWTEIEASLDPASCGSCHAQQYAQWKDSWHAKAMGPGMIGQLVDMEPARQESCQGCHAPNAEQYATLDGQPNPNFDAALQAQGITCAGCHVRGWTRLGPPRRDPATAVADPPHGGFEVKTEFQDSQFCASCHDFAVGDKNQKEDKRYQETWDEWRHTDYAAQGVTCQSCHMANGDHGFKGVHDPETVKKAFTATAEITKIPDWFFEPVTATLTITNSGAGHRFPTYTTPQVTLVVEQVDAAGQAIEGTRQEAYVARRMKPDLSKEIFDTRLMPGESFSLSYKLPLAEGAVALVARVEVLPDEGYRKNYEIWLKKAEERPKGAEMLKAAHAATLESDFVAWEQRLELGGA